MSNLQSTLALPFFNDEHRRFAEALARWADAKLPSLPHDDVVAACRARVAALGEAGLLKAVVPAEFGGLHPQLDVRTLCIARETLAFRDGLADFAFAMQGLGTGSISLYGTNDLKRRYLPPVRDGKAIAAFALSEPEAGSDVAAMATTAKLDGNQFRIDGEKTWISNGGIADHYVVFARTGEAPGARGLSAFVVDADAPGLTVAERIDVIAPHPLARLTFDACACLPPTGWAVRVRASRSPWRRSIFSARRSVPPRWALPAARCTRPSSMLLRASCSARRSATCR